jgi:hypothetical protein
MSRRVPFLAVFFLAATWVLADRLEDTFYIPLDNPAIRYAQPTTEDPVARLEKRIESGQIKLDFAPNDTGYLASVLQTLGISTDSQVLVFSKTSIQTAHISPRTPRAIYFNDNVAVGFVQNGEEIEISSLDPKQGVIFYTLDAPKSDKPEFGRRDDCLRCHQGAPTLGIPGLLVSSIHPQSEQLRDMHGAAFVTDHRTPFGERWGGWYVTGTHGEQRHLGNNMALVDPVQSGPAGGADTQNVTSLADRFDTSRYLAATSDIPALMTLEHQTRMTNLMIRLGWDARIHGKIDDSELEDLVSYMLFAGEAPLKEPVAGISSFTKTFSQRGPRDKQGRSLRDFDLRTRLFRYPLSYMIYSAAFDGMPAVVKDRAYQRLYEILSGKDNRERYAYLSADLRRAILEIVRDTKGNLPSYWSAR